MWDKVLSALSDAAIDTLIMLPFLLAVHIVIELIERSAVSRVRLSKMLNGWYAPAAAGALGLVPQCGFSVVATKLFAKENIRPGTLLAVYIATSDEAIPILISTPDAWSKILPLLLIKLVYAVAVGYLINFLWRKKVRVPDGSAAETESLGCHGHRLEHTHGEAKKTPQADAAEETESLGCHGHRLEQSLEAHAARVLRDADADGNRMNDATDAEAWKAKKRAGRVFWQFIEHPVLHTLTIAAFIFGVTVAFNLLFEFIGEDTVGSFLDSARYAQPFIAGLIGLIPNCGASVVLTQAYAIGQLSLGGAVSGLSVGAGVAYAVLFKENKNIKQNIAIVGGLFLSSALVGFVITLLGF